MENNIFKKEFIVVNKDNVIEQFNNNYNNIKESLNIKQVIAQILGVYDNETLYLETLYNLNKSNGVHILNQELSKDIDKEMFKSLQDVLLLNRNSKEGLSIQRLLACLQPKILDNVDFNIFSNVYIYENLKLVLSFYKQKNKEGFLSVNFDKVLIDLIKWICNNLSIYLNKDNNIPKFIWFGNVNESEMYYIYFLTLLGCDILYFNPEGKELLYDIELYNNKIIYNKKYKISEFPIIKPERHATVGYVAAQEISQILHNDTSYLYKAWQFREYLPYSTTLKTTYDEIFILAKEPAYLRPAFSIEENKIYIPTLFAKINGVSIDTVDFWNKLHFIISLPNTWVIKDLPILETRNYITEKYHFMLHSLNVESNNVLGTNLWKYNHLPQGLQKAILSTIKRCVDNILKSNLSEKEDKALCFTYTCFNLPEKVLRLLENFDYSKSIPKVIIYNNGSSEEFNFKDSCLIQFLNEFGVDIIIYNTAGRNDIETFIDNNLFDIHYLDNFEVNLRFRDKKQITNYWRALFNGK